ncbi:hypothetical protein DNK49_18940 [Azoarcus communis]|uniref:Type VI secretion system tip protein VgrG n=1 Tax=Parazoarcus communis SWub3 = DSM 12120 TaxID=1121029 RepID=A0A323UR16_9RHOO|nr:type VI secretion system tip protein VgrG [Parazoarcus communis SWub3 = DSM 12120]PZA15075.1 hypothetical protein DNK49_18940 [Azoarcus communis] [Parazoarcus communis SWub3 = DSM 12120]
MNRLLSASTPLGDALWAVSLTGREALSTLYCFKVRFKSAERDIDCQAQIGERCAVELETDRRGRRYLSGQMIDFAAIGKHGRHWVYEATVAPRLWHASRRAGFRIWQNRSVPDILYQVLGENAVRFDMRLKATYKTWTYLVQYRETDLTFICRQLEHEGIYFWFEHSADGETLVLADHFSTHTEFPGYASVPYYDGTEARADEDHFDSWRLSRRVEPGRLIHTDYDFEHPSANLTTEHADPRGHLFDHYTRFHYPGDYLQPADGRRYAANTLERLQRAQETVLLAGRVRGAAPGHRLVLREHPRPDQNRELLIVAANYDIADNDYEGATTTEASRMCITVEAMPANRPFRPLLATPSHVPAASRPPSSSARPAKRSTPTSTAASRCTSIGTATARKTVPTPAGSVSPNPGPAATSAPSTCRASARKSSSISSTATPTAPSSPGASITPSRCPPGPCPPTRPSRAFSPAPPWADPPPTPTPSVSRI